MGMYNYYYYVHHRKAWVRRQRIVHSYGQEDEDEQGVDDADALRQEVELSIADGSARPPVIPSTLPAIAGDVDVDIGGKGCPKCGSLTHKRSNHSECPYNKKRHGNSSCS